MLDLPLLRQRILALDGGDETTRREALQSLRQLDEGEWATAPPEAVASLLKALTGVRPNGIKQPSAQKEAATILGNMGPRSRSAVPQLIDWLAGGVPDAVRDAAAAALGKIGKEARPAVDRLVQLLADSRPALSAQAARALGSIGCADSRVRAGLVHLWPAPLQLRSSDAQVAIALCKLRIAAPNLLEAVTRTLVLNQEVGLRKAAAEALAWCGKEDTDVVPALLTAALSDTSEEVREAAQAGLDHMRLSHEKAIRLCARQLGEAAYAETALRKSGLAAVPALVEALGAEEPAVRVKAARTLGCLEEEAAVAAPALTAALKAGDPRVRLAAAKALWKVSKAADAVVPVLVDLLDGKWGAEGEDPDVRRRFLQTILEALGRIGPPATAAVPALTATTKDANRHIRESAAAALQQVRPAVPNATGVRR
jgi:HEAT repeat protein